MRPDPTSYPDRVVVYPSRIRMVLILLGATAFVLAGIWIGTSGAWRSPAIVEVLIASYVGVPFFGFCGLYAVYRLLYPRPSLVIDGMGITDASSALGPGHLSWEEVDHVRLYTISGQPMLGIIPRDIGLFLGRQPPLRRSILRLNLRMGFAPVNISQVTLPMKVADLADLLQARYRVRVKTDA